MPRLGLYSICLHLTTGPGCGLLDSLEALEPSSVFVFRVWGSVFFFFFCGWVLRESRSLDFSIGEFTVCSWALRDFGFSARCFRVRGFAGWICCVGAGIGV